MGFNIFLSRVCEAGIHDQCVRDWCKCSCHEFDNEMELDSLDQVAAGLWDDPDEEVEDTVYDTMGAHMVEYRKNKVRHSEVKGDQTLKAPNIRFYIREDVMKRIKAAAQIADHLEIGGFGYVELREVGQELSYVVVDMMIPTQQVASGGIDLRPIEAIEYGREKGYDNSALRFSWHTHGRGIGFWSDTDENWISDMGEAGMPWLLSMVTNSTSSSRELRLDMFEPFRLVSQEVTLTELVEQSVFDEMEDIIEEKVSVAHGRTVAERTKKGTKAKDVKVIWTGPTASSPESKTVIVKEGTDLDGEFTEQEAAEAMADVTDRRSAEERADPEVTVVHGEIVDLEDNDVLLTEEDREQEEAIAKLEKEVDEASNNTD